MQRTWLCLQSSTRGGRKLGVPRIRHSCLTRHKRHLELSSASVLLIACHSFLFICAVSFAVHVRAA